MSLEYSEQAATRFGGKIEMSVATRIASGAAVRPEWWLGLMLLALHASLACGIADWWPRGFLLAHIGLFLLWQPVWRGEGNVESRYAFLVLIVGTLLTIWNNWWLMAVWLAILFGLIGGSVPGITERRVLQHGHRARSLESESPPRSALLLSAGPGRRDCARRLAGKLAFVFHVEFERAPAACCERFRTTMTTDTPGPQGPAPSNGQPPQETTGRRVFADTKAGAAEAARVSAPVIRSVASRAKGVASRLGDWLATVGWGKFFLVSVLLLILGGIATSIFSDEDRATGMNLFAVIYPPTNKHYVNSC